MLGIQEIDQKRAKFKISKYKLCKDSQINQSHYYQMIKKGNPTLKTLSKLNKSLNGLIKNGKDNGHKR